MAITSKKADSVDNDTYIKRRDERVATKTEIATDVTDAEELFFGRWFCSGTTPSDLHSSHGTR